jgi:hypothetical protein
VECGGFENKHTIYDTTKMKSIIKPAASAAIAISAAAMLSPVAFAGQIGSGSSNTFGHEEYQGRNWSHGNSQTQETVSGVSRSSSSKAEFITPEGQMPGRIQAQFGSYADSSGVSSAYCNAGVNVDPACLTSASRTDSSFTKATSSNNTFGSDGTFHGSTKSVDASSFTNF